MTRKRPRYQRPESSKVTSTQRPLSKSLEFTKSRLAEHKLEFVAYGGAREVGRSSFILQNKDTSILLEGGVKLRPFEPSLPPYGLENHAEELDAIILSHAHVDHSAYIPTLYENGYRGPLHMTHPTLEISYLLWKDHLKIEGERYWTEDALEVTYDHVERSKYNEKTKVVDGVELEFYRAGHILGSAMTVLNWDGLRILYTGDINDNITPLFSGMQIPEFDEPIDIVITESTNGCGPVPSRTSVNRNFIHEVLDTLNRGHKVLVPAFAVGRSQEVLCVLTQHIRDFPIYVDGMINKMNRITERYLTPEWVDEPLLTRLKDEKRVSPFTYDNIFPITKEFYDRTFEFRKHLGSMEEPSIILSTSGMLMPSPMHTHLKYHATDPNNLLAFVGYQADGTVGRDILDGKREIAVRGERNKEVKINIRARVESFRFSGHVSHEGVQELLDKTRPKHTILVHGDHGNMAELDQELQVSGAKYIPGIQESLQLDI